MKWAPIKAADQSPQAALAMLSEELARTTKQNEREFIERMIVQAERMVREAANKN